MTRMLTALFDSGPALWVVLGEVTLLLAGAAFAAALLRRQSAATRHFVWALALGGALGLPVLARVAPPLAVPLPAAVGRPLEPRRTVVETPIASRASALPATGMSRCDPANTTGLSSGLETPARAFPPMALGRWLALVWLAGCVTLLARIGLGHLGVTHLIRHSTPLGTSPWPRLLGDALQRSHLSTAVRLCRSESVGAPITWGWTPPVVLLPASAETWPLERRRAALEHELAHVARRDALTQLGAMLACAIYWFHPLVWVAARRLRIESEHACDDRVLTAGTSAPDYATHLLAVARTARRLRFTEGVVVCMARPSHLEDRLQALLDEGRPRRAMPRWTGVAAALALGLGLFPVAGLRPVAQAAQATTHSNEADSVFEQTVDASPGDVLTLDLQTGGEVVVRGWNENRVRVHAELSGRDWRQTRIKVVRDGDVVRVGSWQQPHKSSSSTSHHFEIWVPKKFDVRMESAGGGLEISDVAGAFQGRTGGGDIVLEHIKGDVQLQTGGGEVRVTDADATGLVSTGGGGVRLLQIRGGLRGTSGSGPVIHSEAMDDDAPHDQRPAEASDFDKVQVDGDAIRDERPGDAAALSIEKAGGDITLEDAPHGARIETGGGNISVRHGTGRVEATTGGGDIKIGPVAGSVTAETGAGDVQVTLAAADGKAQNVAIASGTGRIVVWLPAGFQGRFDLETAYTRSHNHATSIECAWPVERDATTDWDDSQGTARRYVRARGEVGSGLGVVHVRTVNGDIVVKRAAR